MTTQDYQELYALLAQPKKIAILPHRSPDGDAMGSTLALYHLFTKLGHDATVVSPNAFPYSLKWLPSSEKVVIYEEKREVATPILEAADIIFTLDFNAFHRTGEMGDVLSRLQTVFVMIDHHQSPADYPRFMYSDTRIGSTCEMVYNFIQNIGFEKLMDVTIATCIYTGMVTDSGSFRFPSTSPTTHRIVAELLEIGVKNGDVHPAIYDNNTYDSLQLLGICLRNLKIIPAKKTSYSTLSSEELASCNYVKGDTEGFVNYGLSIRNVHFTAIFIEHKDENIIKISFRSKGDFDVNQFARTHFNGGGHINAAGGKSTLGLAETVARFEEIVAQL